MARHPKPPSPYLSPRPPSDSDPSVGFDPVEEWLVDFDPAMSGELGTKGLSPAEEEVVLHAPVASTTSGDMDGQVSEGSVAKSCEFGVIEGRVEEVGSLVQAGACGEEIDEKVEVVSDGRGVLLAPGEVLASGISDLVVKDDISEGVVAKGVVAMEMADARTDVEVNTGVSVEEEGEGVKKKQDSSDEESESSEEEESSEASSSSEEDEEQGGNEDEESSQPSSSSEEELEAVKPFGAGGRKSDSIASLLEEGELMVLSDEDDEEPKGSIKPKHEAEVLPLVPKIEIQLEPHHQTLPVGTITTIMGERVIVEGSVQHNPLNEGSILWITESRTPLGIVDELFGPVKNPYYLVRYNSEEEVPAGITAGTGVSFVVEFADHILNLKELYAKGYDASGDNDEQEDEPEFSDDDKEAEYKRSLRQAKRQTERQHEFKKPFGDKKRSQPKGGRFRADVPPKNQDTPTIGVSNHEFKKPLSVTERQSNSKARFHHTDMVTAVAENTACGPMDAPTMQLPGPMNPAMPSPVHLANQMGGCFINPAQQFLPQQTNMAWPGGFPPQPHMNMGVEGVALAANIMHNLLAGANQFQQQFQNQHFGGFPNQMQIPFPQFMAQTGIPANPMQFGVGPLMANSDPMQFSGGPQSVNSSFVPAPRMPMGQGSFGQPPRQEQGQRPGLLLNSQGIANPVQPRKDGGEHSPTQFSSGQFNQGSPSFRGGRPQQRGGRHFSGRGRGRGRGRGARHRG